MMNSTTDTRSMTLWDAYRLANRRGAAITVHLMDGQGLGNGRTETSLKVSRFLINGHVMVEQGLTADKIFVPQAQAKQVLVSRS